MAMICPECSSTFDQRLDCPKCDVRLVFRHLRGHRALGPFALTGWQQSAWGRIVIGLLLAQGIYWGLRHLFVAVSLMVEVNPTETFWPTLTGLIALQGLQLVGLTVGAALAGAGQRQGLMYGCIVGVWNGFLLVVFNYSLAPDMSTAMVYGQPLMQGVFGAGAGWLGSRIWSPLPTPSSPGPHRRVTNKVAPRQSRENIFAGPIAWVRVVLGCVLALAGTLFASTLLGLITSASEGQLTVRTRLQDQLITWEITALSMLLGGVLAGATTRNGFKQGLAMGIMTAFVLVSIRLVNGIDSIDVLVLTSVSPLILGLVGGGFGAQLIPPITTARRKAIDAAAI